MKGIKQVSIIMTITGILINIIHALIYPAQANAVPGFTILFVAWAIAGCSNGLILIKTIKDKQKIKLIGVLSMITTSVLGGILYLLWNPAEEF